MHTVDPRFGTIHPSVFREGGGFLREVTATARTHGAVRYRCPVTGSFVLVTDATSLERLERPRARLRCVGCGEMHLLAQDTGDTGTIVAGAAKS